MKKFFQNCKYPLCFYRYTIALFIVLFFSIRVLAQVNIVNVPSDRSPGEGNLNKAVQKAITTGTLSGTVFQLEPNGYYALSGTITVPADERFTIVAPEPGTTQAAAPPQIVLSSQIDIMDTSFQFSFNCFGDITLKNLWLLYANTNDNQVQANIQIQDNSVANAGGKGENAVFENVIFDYSACPKNTSGAVGVTAKHFRGIFRNCYFKNCIDSHLRYYGRAVSFPFNSMGWHSDSVEFENCTFANIGYVYSQEGAYEYNPTQMIGGQYSDYVYFNHCTFLNVMMYPLESGWWNKLVVTNSIFVNTFMLGYMPAQLLPSENLYSGTIWIDSVSSFGFKVPFTDHDRRILFTNSSYFIEKWLTDWMITASQWYNSHTHCDRLPCDFTILPQPMLNSQTKIFFDSVDAGGRKIFPYMNSAFLNDSTDPGFLIPPSDTTTIKGFLFHKWGDNGDSAWAWKPKNDLNRLWPLEENLAYINAKLLTAGMGGFPLGDLYHWFPVKYKQWDEQKIQEKVRISSWLDTGRDSITSAVNQHHGVTLKFELVQNYPNPFNPITIINYQIPLSSYVTLKVFDVLGREVAVLFDEHKNAGVYQVTFDGSRFTSGVYLYQLKAGNFVETKKLILLK